MISFNQPRYVLPLIALPFIYVLYYLFQFTGTGQDKPTTSVETARLNPALPDPFLDEDHLKDKFDAFPGGP